MITTKFQRDSQGEWYVVWLMHETHEPHIDDDTLLDWVGESFPTQWEARKWAIEYLTDVRATFTRPIPDSKYIDEFISIPLGVRGDFMPLAHASGAMPDAWVDAMNTAMDTINELLKQTLLLDAKENE